ncbi:MAG TPA: acetyltransferase [Bryobacteraceae bacterium]|jgi:sugar O-acyltransferase (sialic acid O-acetyltransferase NeuD family)|nr:acetyltransferase [Bryobacteraceae bacterium]
MSADGVFVIGASGHAKVVIDIIERQSLWRIAGLIDTYESPGTQVMAYAVLGCEACLPALMAKHGAGAAIVAIGDNRIRCQVAQRVASIAPSLTFVNAVHPSARIARDVEMGKGIAIMAGATVNPGTRIGDFCYVNTNASVDHDNMLERFSCVQPNAATGGNVRLGAFSVLAMGAIVVPGISVGEDTVVGAGSTVLDDLPDRVVAYGTPCRIIRAR